MSECSNISVRNNFETVIEFSPELQHNVENNS